MFPTGEICICANRNFGFSHRQSCTIFNITQNIYKLMKKGICTYYGIIYYVHTCVLSKQGFFSSTVGREIFVYKNFRGCLPTMY